MERPGTPRRRIKSLVWSRADAISMVVVTGVASLLRLIRLDDPSDIVFDETFYARDGCLYSGGGSDLCGIDSEQTAIHPPLGKLLVAAGIKVFGYDSFGWRSAAAIAGGVTIALMYLVGRKLLGSTVAATLVAGLLALDFLHFVQSRIAMLDVFVPLFGLAAVRFLLSDRDSIFEQTPARRWWRPWRLACGVAVGLATASKWPGVFFVLLSLVLTVAWERAAARDKEVKRPTLSVLREQGASIAVYLVVVPLVIYGLTYIGRIEGQVLALPWSEGSWWRALWDRQVYMFTTHLHLDATHPYSSQPWSWLLLKRPVSYFYEPTNSGNPQEILALGNPFVWWPAVLALGYTAIRWCRGWDARGPEGVILAGFVVTYGPWLVQQSSRSAVFLFYMLPVVPFMCLALGYVVARFRGIEGGIAAGLVGAIAIGSFMYFYPILAKAPLSQEEWNARIWFEDCATEPAKTTVDTVISTRRRATITRTTTSTLEEAPPPEGWCWI